MAHMIEIRMPFADSFARRAFATRAIEKCTSKPFRIAFFESPSYDKDRVDVWCHSKGVGPKTREKWTVAVRRALETIR